MSRMIDNLGRTDRHDCTVVRRPRVTDPVGRTLCAAFCHDLPLPRDMVKALEQLDRRPG